MKKAISTQNAPQAIGPYSQGVSFGDLIFITAIAIAAIPRLATTFSKINFALLSFVDFLFLIWF